MGQHDRATRQFSVPFCLELKFALARMILLQDVARVPGPDEWLGFGVVMHDLFIDGNHQFGYAGELVTAQPLDGHIAKEALYHGQPGGRGGQTQRNVPSLPAAEAISPPRGAAE